VDFGIAFEPSTSNVGQAASSPGCNGTDAINAFIPAAQSIAGAGCDRLASTSTGDYSRRRNTVDAGVRYRGTYGPVGLAAYVDYIGSSKVLDSTPVQRALQFDGLNVGIGGIAVTWAGLTVGGMAQGGRFNGQWNLAPKGSSDAFAWLAGASYTYGPFIIGASYYQYGSPGSSGPVSAGISPTVGQRRERGVAAGGTYSLAPGLALFLSYLWGDRKENGFDFITGQVNTIQNTNPVTGVGAGSQNNYVKTQVLTVGTSFTW